MRSWWLLLLFPSWAWARPATFSDGKCSVVFPVAYRTQGDQVTAQAGGARYSLSRTPLRILDPAQHLANLRRAQLAKGSTVHLVRVARLDGLEIRRAHFLARVFVHGATACQAQVVFPGSEPPSALVYVRSLRFLSSAASPYVPQRMARYDTQVRDVPVNRCAENLLQISSRLTGFRLKYNRYPSALSSLEEPLTAAYGYRRRGLHYLLYCNGHHHAGLAPHYPRTDDALRTFLSPGKAYRPGY